MPRRDVLALASMAPLSAMAAWSDEVGASAQAPLDPTTPAARRRALYALLGDLPDRRRAVSGRQRDET